MTAEEAIQTVLFERVRDLETFAADHKDWPNITFTPPTDSWLRIDLLSNAGERFFLKGTDPHLFHGILQLTVVSPFNAGPVLAKGLAGEVSGHFPPDLTLYEGDFKIRIERAPDITDPFRADASWQVPVSIRYQCFAPPNINYVAGLDFSFFQNSQYIPLI